MGLGFGLGLGAGHDFVGSDVGGGVWAGLMPGGTTTGGTTTGGTITGGTTTGGTTTGGTTTVTGGTLTGCGTPIVTVPGFDPVGGFFDPVLGVGVAAATDVEGPGGVGVTAGLVGVMTVVGAGLADGVGLLVAECCFGTTISGLPPPASGVEPKYEPATG